MNTKSTGSVWAEIFKTSSSPGDCTSSPLLKKIQTETLKLYRESGHYVANEFDDDAISLPDNYHDFICQRLTGTCLALNDSRFQAIHRFALTPSPEAVQKGIFNF